MRNRVYHLSYIHRNSPLCQRRYYQTKGLLDRIQLKRQIQLSRRTAGAFTLSVFAVSAVTLSAYTVSAFTGSTRLTSPSASSASSSPSTPSSPLAILPLSTVLRTLLISTFSSSPILLEACSHILGTLAHSESALTNVDRNPLLHWLLKKTFYAQFCAGENVDEVKARLEGLRRLGYDGVVLEYALEVLDDGDDSTPTKGESTDDIEKTSREVEMWRKGMLETVNMAFPGDFVGLKWSGLGRSAFYRLRMNQPPTPMMSSAMHEVCSLAASRSISLLPDAEESSTNPGIESWTQSLQEQYNTLGRAVVYTTIQTYLISAPETLSRHLEHAQRYNYTLGIKLVRGAYLASEPSGILCSTKEATDAQYDALAESLLRRKYDDVLRPPAGDQFATGNNTKENFPGIALVMATHNAASIRKAQTIRTQQAANGHKRIECSYSQLLGMADDVSCGILRDAAAARAAPAKIAAEAGAGTSKAEVGHREGSVGAEVDIPRVYKYVSWGTVSQCLNYLLRRAAENKDAAGRTKEARDAMAAEVWRRVKEAVGLRVR